MAAIQTRSQRFHAFLLLLLLLAFSTQLAAQTVYVTKTGEKYHKEDCQYLRESKIAVEKSDAATRGYTACLVCKPGSASAGSSGASAGASQSQQTSQVASQAPAQTARVLSATQCTGITQAGARCKRTTTSTSGKCYQHD